uniref:Uncharacterized protein n=1 Tax=Arundo donax TaxID=35708 RepID=A0A0A9BWK6_ARUDO
MFRCVSSSKTIKHNITEKDNSRYTTSLTAE